MEKTRQNLNFNCCVFLQCPATNNKIPIFIMSNDNKFNIPKFNEAQQNIEIKNEGEYMSCLYNSKSPSARTILITNNYTQTSKQSSTPNNSSSITIFTHNTDPVVQNNLPLDGINILINNHFNEPQSPKSNMPSNPLPAQNGRPKDIEISLKNEVEEDEFECKKFFNGDDVLVTESNEQMHLGSVVDAMNNKYLVKFGDSNNIEWINSGKLKRLDKCEVNAQCILCKEVDGFVDTCGKCGRGYHMKCVGTLSGIWFCKRRHKNLVKTESGLSSAQQMTNVSELPYEINSLTWNRSHKVNDQDTYCYCGQSGSWYKQMISCSRCQQWFHGDCIKVLNHPLYCGDRFYVFVCSICNHGNEYLQRLQMKIEEVVELILFNLTVYQNKRFYDVLRVIVPYARDNWFALQLSPNMKNMSFDDIRKEIIRVLNGQSARFECGSDRTEFGLRVRRPPSFATVLLPTGPIVTEKYMNEQCRDILLLPKSASTEYIETDLEMKTFMTGDAYKKELSLTDDYDDIKFESEDDSPIKLNKKSPQVTSDISSNSNDCLAYSDRSRDASEDLKPKYQKASRKRGQKRMSKIATDVSELPDMCDESSDDNSSRSTLDLIIPPPKDFHGFNNPFLNESAKQSTEVNSKANTTVKSTNSVPPLTLFGNNSFTPANNQIRFVNIVKRRLCEKDIMIGPNQEVKRRKYKRRSGGGAVEVISTTPIHAFSKSTSYLPIRTDFKDLSVATMRLPTNKESSSSSSTSTSQATTPTEQLTSLPASVHGRRLRKRENTIYSNKMTRRSSTNSNCPAPVTSTNGSSPSTSNGINSSQDVINGISDLHTQLNSYFGAADRIASHEKCIIRGKRLNMNGRVEYLIEWGEGS
ncbi:Polycomb protein Pcl [Pseudolycoriella hygida]|uniref:Polycomb protein Pcl n=1 Tax=Pseudolycoriella hygida TaxID=35572 RepID=A0A9Q0MUQ4_9DIPT|nr:Polycomb protein Pcl [Pseudolycoriella hygida]